MILLSLCIGFQFISATPKTEADDKIFDRAKFVCSTRYGECVKLIEKKEYKNGTHYNVICGGK